MTRRTPLLWLFLVGCTAPGTVAPEAVKVEAKIPVAVASSPKEDNSTKTADSDQISGRDSKSIIDQRTYDSDQWINRIMLVAVLVLAALGSYPFHWWCKRRCTQRRAARRAAYMETSAAKNSRQPLDSGQPRA